MSKYDDLDAIHIVSHGSNGELYLGNTILDQNTLSEYQNELEDWGNAIEEEGDILLYGCNVAADLTGAKFAEELSEYTQADIQASDDLTGSDELGGDWNLEYATGDIETALIFDREIDSTYQHSLQNSISLTSVSYRDDKIIVTYELDDDSGDFDGLDDFVDRELFGGGGDDEEDDEVDVREFDNFASIPASVLIMFAENGLNFAEVNPDILATVDFNNIPAEDFQVLRGAGLSLTPLTTEALGNINLGVFKNFDYLSQVNLAQTRFNSLTTFRDLSLTFVANANLYDYKSELEVDLGIDLDDLVQLSFSDFRAINYAFDGDEIFDSGYYMAQGRDLAGANPFTDYAENGWRQDLDPHPLFDVSYYLGKNTDVRGAGDEPLTHYITKGFAEADNANRDPHPLFDTSYYNGNNTDVVNANKNSLLHFVESGFSENFDSRDPNRFFDSSYYNINNPDVVAAGVNPLVHYIQFGWRESLNGTNPNRDPNPLFDTEFYFETHEDVRLEVLSSDEGNPYQYINANPLQHYIEFGDEGTIATDNRITHPTLGSNNPTIYRTFIDENSEGFAYAQNKFATELNFNLTAREQGGILVASPTLLFNPIVIKGIELAIIFGASYFAADQLDLPEGVLNLYESFTNTDAFESFSITLSDVFTGTPPFDTDAIPSTPEIETFPNNSTLEDILNLDGRFYTPLDPVDELAENVESFPLRDEILEGILDGPFIFPTEEEIPVGFYTIGDPFSMSSTNVVLDKGVGREIRVAEITGGFKVVEPGRPKKDLVVRNANNPNDGISIDVSGPNNELILVGGANKAANIPKLESNLKTLKRIADSLNVSAQYYFADNTPQVAIDKAIDILDAENVFVFPDILLEDLPRLEDLEIIRDRINF